MLTPAARSIVLRPDDRRVIRKEDRGSSQRRPPNPQPGGRQATPGRRWFPHEDMDRQQARRRRAPGGARRDLRPGVLPPVVAGAVRPGRGGGGTPAPGLARTRVRPADRQARRLRGRGPRGGRRPPGALRPRSRRPRRGLRGTSCRRRQRGSRLRVRPLRRRALRAAGRAGHRRPSPGRRARPRGGPHRADRRRLTPTKGTQPMTAVHLDHAPAATVAVAARALTRRYGDGESAVDALRGVSLEVPAGQFTAVMGPSGSGKSTLMHLLAGLDRPTAGSVHVGGEEISTMADRQLTRLRRKHIGFVFQSFNLLPTLTAEENVTLPLAIARVKPPAEEIEQLLARVGLTDRRDHKPAELSGGQQQRVAIARALVTRPTVLFADEPTGNLDSASGAAVLDLLREAVALDSQTTVMVTHDPRAAAVADRVVFLADGRVVGDVPEPTEDEILAAMRDAAVR